MITAPANQAVRAILRHQASSQLATRQVQGKLATPGLGIYSGALDPYVFTQAKLLPEWRCLALPTDDPDSVDLTAAAYRIQRVVGGSWTERLHSDAELLGKAERWSLEAPNRYPRLCPLCGEGPGD